MGQKTHIIIPKQMISIGFAHRLRVYSPVVQAQGQGITATGNGRIVQRFSKAQHLLSVGGCGLRKDGHVDIKVYQPVARLGYKDYSAIHDVFELTP